MGGGGGGGERKEKERRTGRERGTRRNWKGTAQLLSRVPPRFSFGRFLSQANICLAVLLLFSRGSDS